MSEFEPYPDLDPGPSEDQVITWNEHDAAIDDEPCWESAPDPGAPPMLAEPAFPGGTPVLDDPEAGS